MYLSIYIYMYTYTYIFIFVYVFIYDCVCVCTLVNVHIHALCAGLFRPSTLFALFTAPSKLTKMMKICTRTRACTHTHTRTHTLKLLSHLFSLRLPPTSQLPSPSPSFLLSCALMMMAFIMSLREII